MIITFISNYVIKKKIIDKMGQLFCSDECSEIKYIRLLGNFDSVIIGKESDVYVVWNSFGFLYPQYIQEILMDDENYDKIVEDCTRKTENLLKNLCQKAKEVYFISYEDFSNPIWKVANLGDMKCDVVEESNRRIKEKIYVDYPSVCYIDSKQVIAGVGTENAFSTSDYFRWSIPYSDKYMLEMIVEIKKAYEINHGKTYKCIILDCDNVLWGGIINEVGINGIALGEQGNGKIYSDFQRYLKCLFHSGMLLAVCSKNEERDVMEVFENHSGMVLKKENISIFKVNWNNKADNISDIASFLNIGLDSLVFIDDDTREVEMVKNLLPDVKSIVFDYKTIFDKISFLRIKLRYSQDTINRRMNSFRGKIEHEALKRKCNSQEEYLRTIDTKCYISVATENEYRRIAELSQRTNKFNYGKRYSYAELVNIVKQEELQIYSIYVKDKFCDYGLSGALAIDMNGKVQICCLSCRVLGYGIENKVVEFLRQEGKDASIIESIARTACQDSI